MNARIAVSILTVADMQNIAKDDYKNETGIFVNARKIIENVEWTVKKADWRLVKRAEGRKIDLEEFKLVMNAFLN